MAQFHPSDLLPPEINAEIRYLETLLARPTLDARVRAAKTRRLAALRREQAARLAAGVR